MKKRLLTLFVMLVVMAVIVVGCPGTLNTAKKIQNDQSNATSAAAEIIFNQPAPTDLDYSLERYNLIRRAYWVNGQREKANTLICEIAKPLGYIVLFSSNGAIVGNFIVDGKVSSLNSYLFPAYVDDCCQHGIKTQEVPGIDGGYGSNVTGVFFFTPDGRYIEWTGDFLYSDIPFEVDDPVLHYKEAR